MDMAADGATITCVSDRDRFDLLCVGNAIVDLLSPATASALAALELVPGSMSLIDQDAAERLTRAITAGAGDGVRRASGGSAANTAVVAARLGARVAYLGKVADDVLGDLFATDIAAAGVSFPSARLSGGAATARCLVLVTEDGERTMSTFLGAATAFAPEDIDPALIARAGIVYLEGYLFDPPSAQAAFRRAATEAARAGGQVALSLSDAFCIERHRDAFGTFIRDHADIVFGNEAELTALYRTGLEPALAQLARDTSLAVVTRGAAGSVAIRGDERVEIDAAPATVVDTTGAGDAYAAGFLVGLARGESLAACGRSASVEAAAIISQFGARPAA